MFENGELVFVVSGEAEVDQCAFEWLPSSIEAGYRVFGATITAEEFEWLYRDALQATEG